MTELWAVLEGDAIRRYERHPVAVEEGWSCLPVEDHRPTPGPDQIAPTSPTRCAAVDGVYRRWWELRETAQEDLERLRARATAQNNAAAGKARLAYITDVPGQAETYAKKQAEALCWVAAGRPAEVDPAAYPWAARRATRLTLAVAVVLAAWDAIVVAVEEPGLDIEDERERINALIAVAEAPSAVRAALASSSYPMP